MAALLQVGDDSCRTSDIASKALLMYNREAGKKKKEKKKPTDDDNGDGGKDTTTASNSDAKNDASNNDPVGAGAAVAPTLVIPSPAEQKSPSV